MAVFLFCAGATNLLSAQTTLPEDKYGDAIIISSSADARTLIPILASDTASSSICSFIFNGLIKYDKNLAIIGDLASHWKVSEDNLSITFFLHKNIVWHDGKPFTARDVEFTFQKLIDPEVPTPYSGDFLMVKNFEVIDDYTFRVTYKEPFSPGLASWGMGIIPRHILDSQNLISTRFRRMPIGTGGYIFKQWKTQQKIELTYNQHYFEGRPNISRVITRVIPDEASKFLELETGAIDYTDLSPIDYSFKTNTKQFRNRFAKFRFPGPGYTFLGYNLKHPLFTDQRVRIALDYAVNKEEIIKILFFGLAKPITGPFKIDGWAYDPTIKPREFNPEKAKQLLFEAGWNDKDRDGILERNGMKFEFTITTNQGNPQRSKTAEIIQKRLKDIGVSVKIRVLEWSVFLAECVDKRNFDAVMLGWSLGFEPDPHDIWHSSKTKEGEFNFINYVNPHVDELIIKGRRTFDQSERRGYYHQIHRIIFEEQPYMFLYAADALIALDKRFQGIDPGPAGISYNFNDWWVEKNRQKYKAALQP